MADEYHGLLVAALVLVIVLIACFMCLQLFRLRRPGRRCKAGEGFLGAFKYAPSCGYGSVCPGGDCGGGGGCLGVTTGAMPSIETEDLSSCGNCCGLLGIPP